MVRPLLIAALLGTLATPALAADGAATKPDQLKFAVGSFDAFDDNDAVNFEASFHSGKEWMYIHPFVALEATTDSSFWGGFGFAADLNLSQHWVLTPSTSVGWYSKGDGKALGGPIEFESGIEASYRFDNNQRLGLELTHKSNASIYDKNPGVEVVAVTYHIPFDFVGM